MDRLLFPILVLVAHRFRPLSNARLQFLEAQIRLFHSRIDATRIVGGLKKFGFEVGATTVRGILRDAGVTPGPDRGRRPPPLSWSTFIRVTEETIDTGPILDQTRFPVDPDDTAVSVYYKSCEIARQRVVEVVDRIAAEGLTGTPQDSSEATYDKMPKEEDVGLDWRRPAEELALKVRAYNLVTAARFLHRERVVQVLAAEWDAEPANAAPGVVLETSPSVKIATGGGALTILKAMVTQPVAWPWPAPWSRVKSGDMLS